MAHGIAEVVRRLAEEGSWADKSIVALCPDQTRTAPMASVAAEVESVLGDLMWLVALGTHQPMSDEALARHLGGARAVNHAWWDPTTFVAVGEIAPSKVNELSEGRLAGPVPVRVNRLVAEADVVLICGPVFPHEVVGFSGGNKYLFPGVSGPEMIDATHWLGALLTSRRLIGTPGTTPVRALIDAAAALVPSERAAVCFVVDAETGSVPGAPRLAGVFGGTPEGAFTSASELSARTHVQYLGAPAYRVLSVLPPKYTDMWTGAKGMYKVEPVVADGGEVVIYAPHINQFSATHGEALGSVGYHVRDYFLGQWERFGDVPGAVLAHATHLKGDGSWSSHGGERPRITVTLATSIPPSVCATHNLGYLDPATVGRDDFDLVVDPAGETLYLPAW